MTYLLLYARPERLEEGDRGTTVSSGTPSELLLDKAGLRGGSGGEFSGPWFRAFVVLGGRGGGGGMFDEAIETCERLTVDPVIAVGTSSALEAVVTIEAVVDMLLRVALSRESRPVLRSLLV